MQDNMKAPERVTSRAPTPKPLPLGYGEARLTIGPGRIRASFHQSRSFRNSRRRATSPFISRLPQLAAFERTQIERRRFLSSLLREFWPSANISGNNPIAGKLAPIQSLNLDSDVGSPTHPRSGELFAPSNFSVWRNCSEGRPQTSLLAASSA